jgi:FkbM family methyltransferase
MRGSQLIEKIPPRFFVPMVAVQYRYFEPELRRMDDYVPRHRAAVDVGVWWGPWSWWLARHAVRVDAFEPIPELCSKVGAVMPANVRMHNVALSDRTGDAEIWIPLGGVGTEGRSSIEPSHQPATGGRRQIVPTDRLDAFDLPNVGFVKIDVEGHEMAVLRGATGLLANQRPNLLIEIEQMEEGNGHLETVFGFLESLDYRGSFLHARRWRPLGEFNPAAAVEMSQRAAQHGYVGNLLLYARQHVHNFLFRPK